MRVRFGNRARTLLIDTGITVAELAARSELPIKRIERVLEGKHKRITIREMDSIAGVLGTPLYNLLAPSGQSTPPANQITTGRTNSILTADGK